MATIPEMSASAASSRPVCVRARGLPPRSNVAAPVLSVIIVNYGRWDETTCLVRQLIRSAAGRIGAVEAVVVDNHSPVHPASAHLRRWPGVSVRRWGRNRGFARAVNEARRLSCGRWLLLLNPDITLGREFLPGVLALTEELAAQEPRAGIVGFQLRNSNGTLQLSSGAWPTLTGTLASQVVSRARRKYRRVRANQRCQVPWVTGCCLLVRRECLDDLGGLDEDFFLYYEDVDLCLRAHDQGWSVWYEPGLCAIHHHPLHGRLVPPRLRVVTRHALLTYAAKHWPAWQLRLLAGFVWIEASLRRRWALHQGDSLAADHFARLRGIARRLVGGSPRPSRRLLAGVLRSKEGQLV